MNDKQLVALHAAKYVKDGMLVGLGTGSTANFFIEELARLQQEQGLKFTTIASSTISAQKAQSLQLPIVAIEHVSSIDLYVDGADEITPDNTLLKGRGSDLVKEKLLAKAATQFIAVADASKLVSYIGQNFTIPIEVIPFAWQMAKKNLEAVGGIGDLRPNAAKDGFWITSHGSYVLDMRFDASINASTLNALINNTPGVVEHGIFHQLTDLVLIAQDGVVSER
ncbi:ribose-5-phosphate isomerase RpiA [Methylotenera mobilis]|jgi:ribose 5-phosphate isomerase A|uniref:Ribose 5-phosphate isomerase A n=1 Tax=Methylotenera mobilis TaxID=359408 RepID=A0A351RB03_9PROT|nr:ribose-5-phosphate isomerase RpiA [Methylotenera mobilis]PPC96979.1 MAG: ribose-5-phosphate isomerase RpiA [Methylotenera sp.]HBA09224.1 ribose-5-phosphate isomerase RpiA [Methylotenera mobilis]